MRLFPEEEKRKEEIARNLAKQFEFAEKVYDTWSQFDRNPWLAKTKQSNAIVHVAMCLDIQIFRKFRSVIEECRRGETLCGAVVSRSLFESALAQHFVCAEKIAIRVVPEMNKQTGVQKQTAAGVPKFLALKPTAANPAADTDRLTRDFRAHMYAAHSIFAVEHTGKKLQGMPEFKDTGAKWLASVDPAEVSYVEGVLGPAWTYILREENNYSGLSIADLAEVSDPLFHAWYQTIYHFQSHQAHATDALGLAELRTDGTVDFDFISNDSEVERVLQTATSMLLSNIAFLHNSIFFGDELEKQHAKWNDEFHEAFGEE